MKSFILTMALATTCAAQLKNSPPPMSMAAQQGSSTYALAQFDTSFNLLVAGGAASPSALNNTPPPFLMTGEQKVITFTSSAYSLSANTATFTVTNTFVVGEAIAFNNFTDTNLTPLNATAGFVAAGSTGSSLVVNVIPTLTTATGTATAGNLSIFVPVSINSTGQLVTSGGGTSTFPFGTAIWSQACQVASTNAAGTRCAARITIVNAGTLMRFQIEASTTAVGCATTYPGYGIYDDGSPTTPIESLNFSSGIGVVDSGAISVALVAGHTYSFRISQAGAGCTTQATGVTFTGQVQ